MSGDSQFRSKKFVAFLIAEFSWKVALIATLFWGHKEIPGELISVLLSIVGVAGFVEAMYIGGQAALDRYIHLASIAVQGGKTVQALAEELGSKASKPTQPETPQESTEDQKP